MASRMMAVISSDVSVKAEVRSADDVVVRWRGPEHTGYSALADQRRE